MPNPLAYLVLLAWPVVTVALFRLYVTEKAVILSLLLGYLFLPEPPALFDLPLLPPFSKHTIPAMAAFLTALWVGGSKEPILPESVVGRVLIGLFVLSPLATVATNTAPVLWGEWVLPAMGVKEAIALPAQQFLLLLPYLLARRYLATPEAQRRLLVTLVVLGLVYSALMLVEIRLSPQLNLWIYGYYQHDFLQSIRFGGFRPVVFLYHGLWVAFFTLLAAISALALWRMDRGAARMRWLLAAGWLCVVLVLAKSTGAILFALALVPAVLLFGRRLQLLAAVAVAAVALAYPTLKVTGMVPEARIVETAEMIDAERANSLRFRFGNENTLLDRAFEKPAFGWGSWGRNQIYDEITGALTTVADGRWIIVFGTYGWIGFIAEFGLLTLPIFLIWRESRARRRHLVPSNTSGGGPGDPLEIAPLAAPMALMLAVNIFDLLPNATLTPITWFLAGALTGYAELARAERLRLVRYSPPQLLWRPIL